MTTNHRDVTERKIKRLNTSTPLWQKMKNMVQLMIETRTLLSSIVCITLLILSSLLPVNVMAGQDMSVEKGIQATLLKSKALVQIIMTKQDIGAVVDSEIAKLKSFAVGIRGKHQLLVENFQIRSELVERISPLAVARHNVVTNDYLSFLEEYLTIVENLPDTNVSPVAIENLQVLLEQFVTKKKIQLLAVCPINISTFQSKK